MYEGVCMLRDKGLKDHNVHTQLRAKEELGHLYLTAFELQKKIVALCQQRLRLVVQNTSMYCLTLVARG